MAALLGLLALALAQFAAPPAAAAKAPAYAAPRSEVVRLRAFADELFEEGDYFRAATEYRRLLSWYPNLAGAEEVRFLVAQCSYRAGRYAEAADLFHTIETTTTATGMADRCRLVGAACLFRRGDYEAAAADCAKALAASPATPLRDRIGYLEGMASLNAGKWDTAFRSFANVPGDSPLAPSSRELGGLAAKAGTMPHRSPWLTGAMSLLLPGLGQAYCGYWWDGASALLLTAGSLAIGLAGSSNGDRGMALAGYTLFAIWYPAAVYGGANAANRANRAGTDRIIDRAEALSALSLD